MPVNPSLPRTKLDALTGIRFFAASAVILRHFQGRTFEQYPWFSRIGSQGYLAVGLFFLLSGFVLSYNYINPKGGMRDTRQKFWASRFARIYPAYIAAFLLAIGPFTVAISQVHSAGGTVLRIAGGGMPVLLLIQSWTPWTAHYINSPAWSLSVEAFFYFVFPFCLPKVALLSSRACLAALAMLWAAGLAVPSFCCAWLGVRPFDAAESLSPIIQATLQTMPPLRLPEFLMGVVLGRFFLLRGATCKTRSSAWPLASASLVLLAMSFTGRVPESLAGNGLMAPLFLMLIWTVATSEGLFVRVLSARLLVWLGEISYGIYILQDPVWRWYEKLTGWTVYESFYTFCLVLLVAAGLCYHVVERPMRDWIKAKLDG